MSTATQSRTAPDLSFLLAHTSWVLSTRMTAALAEIGMTPRGYCVLNHALGGELTQIELAKLADVDKTTMVVTMDELEAEGLAERRPSPADRRGPGGGGSQGGRGGGPPPPRRPAGPDRGGYRGGQARRRRRGADRRPGARRRAPGPARGRAGRADQRAHPAGRRPSRHRRGVRAAGAPPAAGPQVGRK